MKFELLKELEELSKTQRILFAAAICLCVVIVVYLIMNAKKKKSEPAPVVETKISETLILVYGALCIAMSFVLSYLKLFSMPSGGSITLASMLPLMVYSNRFGVKYGVMASVVYGLLQYIQKPEMTHWVQLLIDYPIAFGVIGLGGVFRKEMLFSVLLGGTLRFLCHLFTGAVFFGQWAAEGQSVFMYSLGYNAPYLFADIAICAVICILPPFRNAVYRVFGGAKA